MFQSMWKLHILKLKNDMLWMPFSSFPAFRRGLSRWFEVKLFMIRLAKSLLNPVGLQVVLGAFREKVSCPIGFSKVAV